MSDRGWTTIAAGFAGVLVVVGILFQFIDEGALVRELSRADPRFVLLVVVATLGWLTAWGLGLRTVLSVLGTDLSLVGSFLVMNGAMFSNNVTPFGQAGGEPVTALLISTTTDTEYQRGLAAITSLDSLNFVPSTALALIGAGYYASRITFSQKLRIGLGALILLAVVVPIVGYAGWRYRYRLQRGLTTLLHGILGPVTDLLPGWTRVGREAIRAEVHQFVEAIEWVARSPRGVLIAFGASALGWGCQMVALWLAFHAVGAPVPFPLVLVAVPVGALAGVTPLPGGAGAIETVLIAVISAIPGAAPGLATVSAAVVIYRGAVYAIPIVIGGLYVNAKGIEYL